VELENLHAEIFEAIRDPLVVINGQGDVYAANAAAVRLFGLAPSCAGAPESRRARFDLDVRILAELVCRRQKMHGVALKDRAGRDTGVEVDVDPAAGPPGHALLHFHAATDSLARELWTDEAVATVAHEFRSPLAGMCSALHLLSSGDPGPLTDHQRRFIGAVERGVARLSRIVDGYLDLARVRAGVLAVDRAEHDARGLVFGITADLALCHPALASRIDVAVEPRVANAFVDPDRVAQVVLNLVYNAARFTPDGGRIAVRVKPAGREALDDPLRVLPFDMLGEPRLVCIEVEDEGIGMSSDVLARVFERHHSGEEDPSATGGAHLGLHISRALVEAQDGWIHMESRIGEGTAARVYLPADPATALLLARLRGAALAVDRLRAARRPAMVALLAAPGIRGVTVPGWWPGDWAINPVRVLDESAVTMVWVVREGMALMVTTRVDAFADAAPHVEEPGRTPVAIGAGLVGDGMTFSGALRAAANSLVESKERCRVHAGSGVEAARE
jgi:signal transduction histidine kinase